MEMDRPVQEERAAAPDTAAREQVAEHFWRRSGAWERAAVVFGLLAAAALFARACALYSEVDPDMLHEMALFREILRTGHVPTDDQFAYTPTVTPCVDHEWATGAVLYFVAVHGGAAGILAVKYLLAAVLAWACVRLARRQGASYPVTIVLLAVPILLGYGRFGSTVRAQMFTYVFLAGLLAALERDRAGRRWWIAPWLLAYVVWLNMHAGAALGGVLLALHTLEQALRRARIAHLLAVLAAMALLVLANPYGAEYYAYVWHTATMPHPLVEEWAPLWQARAPELLAAYAISLILAAYCVKTLGPRRTPGLLLVAFTAFAALRQQRQLDVYAVTWFCCTAGWVQQTPVGAWIEQAWARRARLAALITAGAALAFSAGFVAAQPWALRVPANPGENPVLLYPVGAAEYLEQAEFRGHLMTPYDAGSYMIWKLHPRAKVSMDNRYEVAYRLETVQENWDFYAAAPGWREVLGKYPTDAVLLPARGPLAPVLPETGWARVYADDAFEVYARPGVELPVVDRRGQRLVGGFP